MCSSEFFVIDTAQQQSRDRRFHFKPGGAFPFSQFYSAGEFHNQHLSLDLAWGLRRTIFCGISFISRQPTPEAKFQVMEEKPARSMHPKPLLRHPAVNFALHEFGDSRRAPSIASKSAARSVSSSRRFIDVFHDQVGLNAAESCSAASSAFQNVLHRIGMGRDVDWTDVALSCGYFDQAHFIHDFKAFSGLSPTAYAAHQTEHLNHVPILD